MKKTFLIFFLILVAFIMLMSAHSCKKTQKPVPKKEATNSMSIMIPRSTNYITNAIKTDSKKNVKKQSKKYTAKPKKKKKWQIFKKSDKKIARENIRKARKVNQDKDWWKFWKNWGKKGRSKAIASKKRDKDWWKFWKNWGKKGRSKAIASKKHKHRKKKGKPFIVLNWEALKIDNRVITKKQRRNIFIFGGIALAGVGVVVAMTLLHHPKI